MLLSDIRKKKKAENRTDRRISGPKGQDLTRRWSRLCNVQLHELYPHCTGWLQISVTTHTCASLLTIFVEPNFAQFAPFNCNTNWVFYVYGSVHRWSILITVQRDATHSSLFIILQVQSTRFGCQPHPPSGVHKTVTTTSGTVQLPPCNTRNM